MLPIVSANSQVKLSHAFMLSETDALPPLKSPLKGLITIDHGRGMPLQSIEANPLPMTVATRPTACVAETLRNANALREQDAVPVIVAVPSFAKRPDASIVMIGFGAMYWAMMTRSVPPEPTPFSTRSM
jgi:hypothetical protein